MTQKERNQIVKWLRKNNTDIEGFDFNTGSSYPCVQADFSTVDELVETFCKTFKCND